MDRVERIAVADSARNVHQDAEILALQRGQDSAAADRATTRVIAFETYRTVLAMLCRDDGRSPSQCDEESLRKARETLGDYAP